MQWQMAQALGRCAEMRSLQSILNELWVPPVPHPRRAPLVIVCARRGHSAQTAAPGGSQSRRAADGHHSRGLPYVATDSYVFLRLLRPINSYM